MLSYLRFQTFTQVAYFLSRDSSALPREYKATRSNVRNSCWSRRKLPLSLMCTEAPSPGASVHRFTGEGVGVGIAGGDVRALRTLWKSRIGVASGVISLKESVQEESERVHFFRLCLIESVASFPSWPSENQTESEAEAEGQTIQKIHVLTLCDWFSSSASACDSNDSVFTWS